MIKDHPSLVKTMNPANIVKKENVIGLVEKSGGAEQQRLPGNFCLLQKAEMRSHRLISKQQVKRLKIKLLSVKVLS